MTNEILRRLQRLHEQATGVHELMSSLHTQAPQSATAHDPTGSVRVSIGADGLPTAIRIESDWQAQLAPQAVGDAVLAAFNAAVAEGMRAWAQVLEGTSWRSRLAEFEAGVSQRSDADAGMLIPHSAESTGARDLHEIAEEALRQSASLRRQHRGQATLAVGSDGSGNASITLSRSGLQACSVRAAWASRHDGSTLTAALNDALRAARAELPVQSTPVDLTDLLGDALTALRRIRPDTTTEDPT
jgi:hypothetical protein